MKTKLILFITLFYTTTSAFSQDLKIGDKAPNIVQNSVNGEDLSLSSLKGQMVLIDFWASWCVPCRKENPNLIENYNKYKDAKFKQGNGFTILSISLDAKKDRWLKAIDEDGLIWPNHTSDLKGWRNRAAMLYKIKSVPTSYLINGEGVIVAINPRGSKLNKILRKEKKGMFSF